jgi:hypothetical protein
VAPFEFLAANNIPAKDSVRENTFDAFDWIFTSGIFLKPKLKTFSQVFFKFLIPNKRSWPALFPF